MNHGNSRPAAARSFASVPVAVVGMACRLPGAEDLAALWRLIREGRSTVAPVPADRLDRELLFAPEKGRLHKTYSDLACTIDYPPPDPATTRLDRGALDHPEPLFAALCETAVAAAEQGGFDVLDLPVRRGGVFLGHTRASGLGGELAAWTSVETAADLLRKLPAFAGAVGDRRDAVLRELVRELRREARPRSADGGPALGASVAARLTASVLGLSGPTMAFNSACASSLQALIQAMRAVQSGRLDLAVAGGASYFHSDTLVLFSQAQSLSATGSRPWDAAADGLVVGEGCAVFLLKRLDRALADGDRIQAVLGGVGMSSDGKGKSLWAPRKEGQVLAVRRAYADPAAMGRLQYIEAHATSTQVGDATEIAALDEALAGSLPPGVRIPLGSVKGNVGHTLEVAGAAGLVKTILALQHATIPPVCNLETPHPQIPWERVPFRLPRTPEDWPSPTDGGPRRAAVNAFGIGGLNTHLVVDEFAPVKARAIAVVADLPPAESPECDGIAVVGLGAVLPGARGIEALLELLHGRLDPKSDVPAERWNADLFGTDGPPEPGQTVGRRGGFVRDFVYDWKRHKLPPKQVAQASPLQFMILDAVEQAVRQAGFAVPGTAGKTLPQDRTGVMVGTIFGGEFNAQLQLGLLLPRIERILTERLVAAGVPTPERTRIVDEYKAAFLAKFPALLDETGSFTASSLASRITKSFDLHGGACAVDGGNGSTAAALACCVDQLAAGDTDLMICVGAQQDLGIAKFEAWSLSGQLTAATGPAPLDAAAAGVFPGEGCTAFLLKRHADAVRDGDRIFGIVRGLGAGLAKRPDRAAAQAVAAALADARAMPQDIRLVEWTGTGTPLDAEELAGLAAGYRTPTELARPLTTAVPRFGHSGGAVGGTALLRAVLALDRRELPDTVDLTTPSPAAAAYGWFADVAAPSGTPFAVESSVGRTLAAVHAGGAGETAYHVLVERGDAVRTTPDTPPVSPSRAAMPVASPKPATPIPQSADEIPHFDATARRRERLRQGGKAPAIRVPAAEIPPIAAIPPAISNSPATVAPPMLAQVHSPAAAAPQPPLSGAKLQAFLVDFVVEQTGYPPDIVELDADLEADLGIDSIKKAQLFGELREHFDIRPVAGMTLDDFPTLRHVLNFIAAQTTAAPALPAPVASPALATPLPAPPPPVATVSALPLPAVSAAPRRSAAELEKFLVDFVVEQTGYPPDIVELDADLEADLGIDSIKKAQLFGELRETFDIRPVAGMTLDDFPTLRHVLDFLLAQGEAVPPAPAAAPVTPLSAPEAPHTNGRAKPTVVPSPAPVATAVVSPPVAVTAPRRTAAELEKFLVDFVVEQTGYPPDIVELDADLEADLGIDSIKKAQLFGELRETFDIRPVAGMTLDDFPTLRHVLAFLLKS